MPTNTKPSLIAYSKYASLPMKFTTWTCVYMKKYTFQVQSLVIRYFTRKLVQQWVKTNGLELQIQAVDNSSLLEHSMSPKLCWKVEPMLVSTGSQVHWLIYSTLLKKYDCTESMHSQGNLWCKWSVSWYDYFDAIENRGEYAVIRASKLGECTWCDHRKVYLQFSSVCRWLPNSNDWSRDNVPWYAQFGSYKLQKSKSSTALTGIIHFLFGFPTFSKPMVIN